jgi:hypothetical protein
MMFSSVSENWSTFSSMDDRLPEFDIEVEVLEPTGHDDRPHTIDERRNSVNVQGCPGKTNMFEERSSISSTLNSSDYDRVATKKPIDMLRITSAYCKTACSHLAFRRRSS